MPTIQVGNTNEDSDKGQKQPINSINAHHISFGGAYLEPRNKVPSEKDSNNGSGSLNDLQSSDIQIVRQNVGSNLKSSTEEEKEEKTTASETLAKEADSDGEEIKFESFELLERLGKGNFGEVFRAILKKEKGKPNPRTFALKAMKKSQVIGNNQLKYVISELNIMKQLHHPFIVSLHFSFQTPKYLYLVMEYWSGRDLAWHLDKTIYFAEQRARFCIAEVILAIEYLHSKDIIYRDLKPSNVLVSGDGHIKLIDFGLAKEGMIGMEYAQTFWGSPAYLAPELLKEKKFNKSSDIYQIGVLLFELLTGKPPFYKSTRDSLFENIKNSYNLEVPTHVSPIAIDLLGRLLNKIPSKRLGVKSFEDLKSHEFFSEIDWTALARKNWAFDGMFTEEELRLAEYNTQDSMDLDEEVMKSIKNKVNFQDEDYKDDEGYSPLGGSYASGKFYIH